MDASDRRLLRRLRARVPLARREAAIGAAALIVFAASWGALHLRFFQQSLMSDTATYQAYGDAITNLQMPYRDFNLEYPPGALPVFVLPAALRPVEGDIRAYDRWFEVEMFGCGAVMLACVLVSLSRLEASPRRLAAAMGFTAIAPVLVGSLVLVRFDLWPASLTACALAALLSGRNRMSSGLLGLAFAAKLYPAVLLPVSLVWVWRRRGVREAAVSAGVFAAVALACFLPFVLASPHGMLDAMQRQTNRPLQIESLGAGALLVAHSVFAVPLTVQSSFGSQNLVGGVADALPGIQTAVQLAAIVLVWAWFAIGAAEPDRLVRAFAAAVVAFVAFGKVLSPQFLIWLLPFVPLVRWRRGIVACGVFGAALVLTQLWFPARYWNLVLAFGPQESWLVFVRDVALAVLLAVLLVRRRRGAGSSRRL